MRLLVLATEPVDADRVRAALPDDDLSGAQVLVVSPAVNRHDPASMRAVVHAFVRATRSP